MLRILRALSGEELFTLEEEAFRGLLLENSPLRELQLLLWKRTGITRFTQKLVYKDTPLDDGTFRRLVLPDEILLMTLPLHSETSRDLRRALDHGEEFRVSRLLEERQDPNAFALTEHESVLIRAAKCCPSAVSLLIEAGADVNAPDAPLVSAINNSGKEVVRALLDARAHANLSPEGCRTPLIEAIHGFDIDIVRLLLIAMADANLCFRKKCPLQIAFEESQPETLMELAKAGANPHILDSKGRNLLFCADDVSMVAALICARVEVNAADAKGNTPLMLAFAAPVVVELLNARADLGKANNRGDTALFASLRRELSGKGAAVEELLRGRVDVNQVNGDGQTPLGLTAMFNHPRLLAQLLSARAAVDMMNYHGQTPLLLSAEKDSQRKGEDMVGRSHSSGSSIDSEDRFFQNPGDNDEVAKLLLDAEADLHCRSFEGTTPLMAASKAGQVGTVKLLLAAKADGNEEIPFTGWTSLLLASREGHVAVVQALLEAGVNKDKPMTDGGTPLLAASKERNEAVIQALVASRADVNKGDSYGSVPLAVAAEQGNLKRVRLLLAARASMEMKDIQGKTPLAHACCNDHFEVASILLSAGADKDSPDVFGASPLMLGVGMACSVRTSQVLLSAQANPDQTALDGATALSEACTAGLALIVGQLLSQRADMNTVDYLGRSPLSIACVKEDSKVVMMLLSAAADANKGAPLHAVASRAESIPLACALLSARADVDMVGPDRATPLTVAIKSNQHSVARTLILAAADLQKASVPVPTALLNTSASVIPPTLEINDGSGTLSGLSRPTKRHRG